MPAPLPVGAAIAGAARVAEPRIAVKMKIANFILYTVMGVVMRCEGIVVNLIGEKCGSYRQQRAEADQIFLRQKFVEADLFPKQDGNIGGCQTLGS